MEKYFQKLEKVKNNLPTEWIKKLEKIFSSCDIEIIRDFLQTIRSYSDLNRDLLMQYPSLNAKNQKEVDLAKSFYPINGFGYCRSNAYRQSTTLGSIFKIVTAYAALKQQYHLLLEKNLPITSLNPLNMVDKICWDRTIKNVAVGYNLNNIPYPRIYKKGRLPKSSHYNIGKVDIVSAMEQSSNPYFSILAGDYLKDPQDLINVTKQFGFGNKTNIDIPGEIKGVVPEDIHTNRTGLYSLAIGQHSLVVTPLQTALMLAAIANGGFLLQPKIIMDEKNVNIQGTIFLPSSIRLKLLESMDSVISGKKGSARPSNIKKLNTNLKSKEKYQSLIHQFVGKTSTSEIMHKTDIIPSAKAQKYKHIWFGAISFEGSSEIYDLKQAKQNIWDKPEIIVVVYLQFGDGGKEAAPIATEIIHKYREIKAKYP